MAHIHQVNIDSSEYLIEPLLFAIAGGTSTALTATINHFELAAGVYVSIKVGNVGGNATLNVNNTGDKQIRYNNSQIDDNTLLSNHIYTFLYDGTYWVVVGDIIRKNVSVNNHNLIFSSN